MTRRALPALIVLLALPASAAAERGSCPPACDLASLRERALASSPAIGPAEAALRRDLARRDEAWAAAASVGSAELRLDPTADRSGDVQSSGEIDPSFDDDMGLWVRLRLYAVVPLSPWWRIWSAARAATAASEVTAGELRRAQSRSRSTVETAYRDAQLADRSHGLLAAARQHIAVALERVQTLLEEDLPGADERDRLRLEISLADLDARIAQARRSRELALARLREAAGLPGTSRVELPPLPEAPTQLAPLLWYLEAARRGRPEVRMGASGIRAARALRAMRLAELVPDVGVAGYYSLRAAPFVDDQTNPFVVDSWNGVGGGFGLVLDWTFDPVGTAARAEAARAEQERAAALLGLALGGIAFEVESAHARAVETGHAARARGRARQAAEDRLETVLADFREARADSRDLAGAVSSWLGQELACERGRRDLLVALADLEEAAGLEPGALASDR